MSGSFVMNDRLLNMVSVDRFVRIVTLLDNMRRIVLRMIIVVN